MRKKQDKNALEVDLPQQHATGKGGKKAFAKVRAVPPGSGRDALEYGNGRASS